MLNLIEATKAFSCCIILHWAEFCIGYFEIREDTETEKTNKSFKRLKSVEQKHSYQLKKYLV